MAKKLVIVESPSKSKTIEQYLGPEYVVKSSKGHIRDLAISGPGGLGIDVENNFKAEYSILPDKSDIVKQLNQALKKSSELYLATDPDREGEAISWHLAETLEVEDRPIHRIVFNEITKKAVMAAFEHPREIDGNLVNSQEARRIIDRIIGFKLSKLLQSKIRSKSAGRVQSATLKLITDREQEIADFVVEEYYELTAEFGAFEAKLNKWQNKPVKMASETMIDEVIASLSEKYRIARITQSNKQTFGKPPYITSTLQQDSANRLGFTASKTMQVAQRLYEGIEKGSERVALITYMRTDSTRLADDFVHQAHSYIVKTFGKDYLGHLNREKTNKRIQDAHEAIRPTDLSQTPDVMKAFLSRDEYALYRMIFQRAVASLMKPSISLQTVVEIENNQAVFRASGSQRLFDGYLACCGKEDTSDTEEAILPALEEGSVFEAKAIQKKQLFTAPPQRYNEARLIKEMEDLGIGRPSTYAQTIQVIKSRKYVTFKEKKFFPTEQGIKTIAKLNEFFHEFVSANYSKKMEDTLDSIAEGTINQTTIIREFYEYFVPLVQEAFKNIKKEKPVETGEDCPKCGSKMVIRKGAYGDFEACSNYPKCKYIKPDETKQNRKKPQTTNIVCPKCHEGKLVVRLAKRGKNRGSEFLGCSTYPKCDYVASYALASEVCPKCGQTMVTNDSHALLCLNPECTESKK
jgi:DNA topoisomerase-1